MLTETDQLDRETLIRLANSCDRAAANNATLGSRLSDLDADDFRKIASVPREATDLKA